MTETVLALVIMVYLFLQKYPVKKVKKLDKTEKDNMYIIFISTS